jgi:hypothetical protein
MRQPSALRVASLNSKTLTNLLLSSANRSIARSDRSTLDYVTDLVHEVTQDLPKLMLEELKKSLCIGLDDTQVKLIMPKEIPDDESGGDELQFQRLIEKMKEAKKANQDSIDAKMWGYSGFDSVAPYDVFDFRVSRHRDGPKETLAGYEGHVMADCYSGNLHVILAPDSKMTRTACWSTSSDEHCSRQPRRVENCARRSHTQLSIV